MCGRSHQGQKKSGVASGALGKERGGWLVGGITASKMNAVEIEKVAVLVEELG